MLEMISEREKIVINKSPNRNKWEEYVNEHPKGNIFQTPFMYDVYNSTPLYKSGVIAIEDESENILGLMVYVLIGESGVKSFFSTRSIITGGPIVKNDNGEYIQILLNHYVKKINKSKTIYTEIRNLVNVKETHNAFANAKFVYQDHLTVHVNLNQPIEVMQKALHKKKVDGIRRATNKNVKIKDITINNGFDLAFELIQNTYKRINLPAPDYKLFSSAAEIMPKHVKFLGAYVGEKLIGCRVYLIYKDVIFDWYAANDRDSAYNSFHANDLLDWSAMLWAKDNNFKLYDFAGAGKPGKDYKVRDYKLRFGGILLNFGRYHYFHKPLLYKVGVWGIKLYKYIR